MAGHTGHDLSGLPLFSVAFLGFPCNLYSIIRLSNIYDICLYRHLASE